MLFGIRQHAVKRKLERADSNRTRHIQRDPREQSYAFPERVRYGEHRRRAEHVPEPRCVGLRLRAAVLDRVWNVPLSDLRRQNTWLWPRSRSDALERGLGGIEADAHHRTRIHALRRAVCERIQSRDVRQRPRFILLQPTGYGSINAGGLWCAK